MKNVENEPLCVLTDAVRHYGRTRALGPVSLTVRSGQILGVRGPNGAGKSTLLSLLAGDARPDSGTCVRSPAALASTSWVPQELSLYESLTALQNLRFWGIAAGLPPRAIRARSLYLLDRLGLSDKGRARVSSCSGGMKRRIHLASALMVTPALLLLDEPTVGADADSVRLILELLKHLRSLGVGVVLISHRPGELEEAADRIITMEAGLITGEAAP